MSERWKLQLRFGAIFGIVYTIMMSIMDEKSLAEQLNSTQFYARIVVNFLFAIFIIGYFIWKGQDPKNNSWKTIFKKDKN
jgi:hypothetical protein